MTKLEKFQNILNSAALSARKKAFKKNLPVAISEEGQVKLIYPNKRIKILSKKASNN